MDIALIKPSERTIEIHHPVDETKLLGIRVSLVSMTDPRMKKLRRRIQDEKLKLEARGKNFRAADVEENQNELIFNAMTGWQWYNTTGQKGDKDFDEAADAKFKGKKPEFNRANVLEVLNEPGMEWFADQISEAIADEKAFF